MRFRVVCCEGVGYYYDDDSHHLCVYLIQHSTASATIIIIITRKCFLFSFHIFHAKTTKYIRGIIINTTFAVCVQTRYIGGKKNGNLLLVFLSYVQTVVYRQCCVCVSRYNTDGYASNRFFPPKKKGGTKNITNPIINRMRERCWYSLSLLALTPPLLYIISKNFFQRLLNTYLTR